MTKKAAQNEVEQVETVEFEWDGFTYTVPASLDLIDIDTLEQLVDGNALTVVRALLGPQQWQVLKDRARGKQHNFAELRAAIDAAMGQDTGESSASSD